MSLTIIQLTDIHFSIKYQNPLLDRKDQLFRAIASEARNSSALILLVTGDIANFGISKEYNEIAFDFFLSLKDELIKELQIKIDIIFLPGNHDCDFSNNEENQVRTALVEGLKAKNFETINDTMLNMIIRQNPFNEFRNVFHEEWEICETIFSHPLIETVKIYEESGNEIILNLYNSSWLSFIKETPGQLFMPITIFEDIVKENKSAITISAVHHPDHWFYPENRREWVNFLEKTSNFILTGHEHVVSAVEKTNWNNKKTHYIEGRSLQDHSDSNNSGFNILKLDNSSFLLSHYQFTSEKRYEVITPPIEKEIEISSIFGKDIEIKESLLESLNDIGIPLTHPRKKDLKLNDLFVMPDVEEVLHHEENHSTFLEESLKTVLQKDKESILFITGDHESGKTSLSKIITMNNLMDGIFPLLVKGTDIKGDVVSNINKLINRICPNMYRKDSLETYKQLTKQERILIIDDWNQVSINSRLKQNFIKNALPFFRQIIILSEINSNISEAIELIPGQDEYNLRHFQILEFGHVKQDELLTKWISIGQEEVITEEKLIREKEEKLQALRPIVSNGLVPRYPIYLLIMLKAIENGEPHDLSKSSNGYYFEVLIKDALSSIEIRNKDLDKLYTYLTGLAEAMSSDENRQISIETWRTFHNEHLAYHDLEDEQLNLKEYREKLVNNKIIKQVNDCFKFNHPYLYYYFVAQYYASRMGQLVVQEKVKVMCQNLHNEEYANIIMFLTHLSKEEIIIEEVLGAARNIFSGIEPLQLNEDISVVNELIGELYKVYEITVENEINVTEYRRQQNQEKDQHDRDRRKTEEIARRETAATEEQDSLNAQDVVERIEAINKGFKIIEITGQILKNYYGSLSSTQKTQLCEELFKLGFRIVHIFIDDLKQHHVQLINLITSHISERGQKMDSKQSERYAKHLLFRMSGFIIYKTMVKIGLSVGTVDLDSTYKRVIQSLDYHSTRLTYVGIKLDYYDQFPLSDISALYKEVKENPMAKTLLQEQVRRYLYMFPTNYAEKQKYCASVDLKISPTEQLKLSRQ